MKGESKLAIYPGTFDPVTKGHMDIVHRASSLFDRVVVSVTNNPAKTPLFSVDERIAMIRAELPDPTNVSVEGFDELLMDYAQSKGADVVVRGLRAVTDFEFEFQMALVNRKLCHEIVTVFLMPNEKYTYLNSTIVREVAKLGGDVSWFVSPNVQQQLSLKYRDE